MIRRKEILIIMHAPAEGAGTLETFLRKRKAPYRILRLYEGEALPAVFSRVGGVVILGGPMNVDEHKKYPFLIKEKRFIRGLITRKIPCMGICLGCQLIARAAGRKVYKAKHPEVGWKQVVLTDASGDDALFGKIPARKITVLQWHGDTFDLPKRAVLLAKGTEVKNQAFRLEDRIYGLQFHLEADRGMITDWFGARRDLKTILKTHRKLRKKLSRISRHVYGGFLKAVRKD